MNYTSYQNSRNLSWEIIINEGINALPVKMSELCRKLQIDVVLTDSLGQSGDGKTMMLNGIPHILIDQTKSPERQRFTLAHELGHILLGHVGRFKLLNREPNPNDNPIEQAANVFASRLLAPACVLWALDIHSADEIAELCQISKTAAEFRAERMAVLYAREQQFLKEKGKSCFLLSPLERQVYEQFLPFIEKKRN